MAINIEQGLRFYRVIDLIYKETRIAYEVRVGFYKSRE